MPAPGWASSRVPNHVPHARTVRRTLRRPRQHLLLMIPHDIFRSRRSATNSTRTVSISQRSNPTRTMSRSRVARQAADLRLPLFHSGAEALKLPAGHDPRAAGFDVENVDPPRRCRRRELIREAPVDQHQEHVVRGVQEGQLLDELRGVGEQKIRDDRDERGLAQMPAIVAVTESAWAGSPAVCRRWYKSRQYETCAFRSRAARPRPDGRARRT